MTQIYCETIRFCKWCKDIDFLLTLSTQEWKSPWTLRYINILLNYVKIYFRHLFKKIIYWWNYAPLYKPNGDSPTKYTWMFIVKIVWLCTELCFVWGCSLGLFIFLFVYLFWFCTRFTIYFFSIIVITEKNQFYWRFN